MNSWQRLWGRLRHGRAAWALNIAVCLMATACGRATMPNAPQDGTQAVIQSVGDTGFRINRTLSNREPAPYVVKVDDVVADFATWVTAKPGMVRLVIVCLLPGRAADGVAGVPFARRQNGEAPISGSTHGAARADIELVARLEAGATYRLQCAPIGETMARAWLIPENP